MNERVRILETASELDAERWLASYQVAKQSTRGMMELEQSLVGPWWPLGALCVDYYTCVCVNGAAVSFE